MAFVNKHKFNETQVPRGSKWQTTIFESSLYRVQAKITWHSVKHFEVHAKQKVRRSPSGEIIKCKTYYSQGWALRSDTHKTNGPLNLGEFNEMVSQILMSSTKFYVTGGRNKIRRRRTKFASARLRNRNRFYAC